MINFERGREARLLFFLKEAGLKGENVNLNKMETSRYL